jgi:hypothetical protein
MQAHATWTYTSTDQTGFRLERKTGAGAYGTITETTGTVLAYNDATALHQISYTYRIYATNTAGDGPASNEVLLMLNGGVAQCFIR